MENTLRVIIKHSERRGNEVLILVLMEDTLRATDLKTYVPLIRVLILVLMEDTLRVNPDAPKSARQAVLILVLMEDTLREKRKSHE